MPDVTLKDLQAEKDRLHGTDFNGLIVIVDSATMMLKIKDSRAPSVGGNPRDFNQALTAHGHTPGSWHPYSLAQSQATFV
jgi:hypothetical protein